MVVRRKYDPTDKEQVFATLRREILAARLKVTLDERLNRKTSPTVMALSRMSLPPLARPHYGGENDPVRRTYDPTSKEQVFATLRREILAAQLKVTLDEQLGRETSSIVVALSRMQLPPTGQT